MKLKNIFLFVLFVAIYATGLIAQETRVTLRGSYLNRRSGIHNGNLVHTIFSNYGVIAQPSTNNPPRGAWKFDNNGYVGDVSPVVGVRLPIGNWNKDTLNVPDTLHSVVITPVSRPGGGEDYDGVFSGFEPLPGFFNSATEGVAMSHLPETWPPFWPNRPDIDAFTEKAEVAYTPKVDWYGYFGRGRAKAATQESYFWMDDDQDREFYGIYGFIPDTLDKSRRGQALQVNVRGLQWGGDPVAQNVIFWLYNIKNDGTATYDQAVFGCVVGTYVGIEGDEWNDDVSFFEVREAITYTWDFDGKINPASNPRWLPNPTTVGYVAYAFLESPGNGYDGIDNDRDNGTYSAAPYFTENDFVPKTINANSSIVLIDKNTFARTPYVVKATKDTVVSMGVKFIIEPGVTQLVEGDTKNGSSGTYVNPNAYDGIDNDLDGIIDENYTVHYRQYKKSVSGTVLIDTINATQYVNYLGGMTGAQMIDERRDDGIDNDKDWTLADDVGQDGKKADPTANPPVPKDFGEGDGFPTPGEPNVDLTDIHESDQLGLTSFQYYAPSNGIKMADDEDMWLRLTPGKYEVPSNIRNNIAIKGEDGDFIYGSGYFPLLPGQTERFSLALAFGEDFPDVLRIKRVVQIIYNANYTFPLPPDAPTLAADVDLNSVHLYWGPESEASVDHITKEKDFEGYKIYKSGRSDFSDIFTVSDTRGNKVAYKELVQYDLANGITGFYALGPVLSSLYNGFAPYLGSDNGIVHEYTDTEVKTGLTYFYVVTAYDHGKNDSSTYPKENSVQGSISRDAALGTYTFSKNAVMAVPKAKVAGFIGANNSTPVRRVSGSSNESPSYRIIDQKEVKTSSYIITFKDTMIAQKFNFKGRAQVDSVMQGPVAVSYTVADSATGDTLIKNSKVFNMAEGSFFRGLALQMDSTWISNNYIQKDTSYWKLKNPKDTAVVYLGVATPTTFASTRYPIYRAPKDYAVVFFDTYNQKSYQIDTVNKIAGTLPLYDSLNFKVYDITDPKNPIDVKFAYLDEMGNNTVRHTLSSNDRIFISDANGKAFEWLLYMNNSTKPYTPIAGDTLYVKFKKALSSKDKFVISTVKPYYDKEVAKNSMGNIRVVPNPYIVTNLYETPPPTGVRGRGDRVIKFMNLPPNSKIHIYTSSGVHVRDLQGGSDIFNSELSWDLRTKEGLDVAFGIYFYVVEAEGISSKKSGKIAIIK